MMKREIEYNKEDSLIASMSSATIIDSYNKGLLIIMMRKLNSKGQNNKDLIKSKNTIDWTCKYHVQKTSLVAVKKTPFK